MQLALSERVMVVLPEGGASLGLIPWDCFSFREEDSNGFKV